MLVFTGKENNLNHIIESGLVTYQKNIYEGLKVMSLKIGVLMGEPARKISFYFHRNEVLRYKKNLDIYKKNINNEDYKKYIKEFKDCDLIFNALHGGEGRW